MSHSLNLAKLQSVFDCIEENEELLNDWEKSFFASVSAQWEEGRNLSERQLEVLERIYLKCP